MFFVQYFNEKNLTHSALLITAAAECKTKQQTEKKPIREVGVCLFTGKLRGGGEGGDCNLPFCVGGVCSVRSN